MRVDVVFSETRQIHPRALAALGEEVCALLLRMAIEARQSKGGDNEQSK